MIKTITSPSVENNTHKSPKELRDERFFASIQKYINIYMFFLPIMFAKIGGISFTFFIFLIIIYKFLKNKKKLFRLSGLVDYLVILFFAILILSMIYGEETYRPYGEFADIKKGIQMIYWMMLALFLKTWTHKFNFYQIGKYLFYGLLVLVLGYFLLGAASPNAFSFTMVLSTPIALYYIMRRFSFLMLFFISSSLFFFVFLSGSRTGAIVIMFQVLIYLLAAKLIRKKTLPLLISVFMLIAIITPIIYDTLKVEIASIISPYNPDLAKLIANTDKTLSEDKSWLERKQYIIKGISIFKEHPLLGIGAGRFKYYWVNMEVIPELGKSLDFLNRHSPHNSYIQVLAGSGIIALTIMLLLQYFVLKKSFKLLFAATRNYKLPIVLSFLGMSIYFYVIANAFGSITWVVIGYGLSLLKERK